MTLLVLENKGESLVATIVRHLQSTHRGLELDRLIHLSQFHLEILESITHLPDIVVGRLTILLEFTDFFICI